MILHKYSATSWHCSSCIQVQKLLDSLDLTGITVQEIDVDTVKPEDLRRLNIRGIPMLILYDNSGLELKRIQGVPAPDRLKKFLGLSF